MGGFFDDWAIALAIVAVIGEVGGAMVNTWPLYRTAPLIMKQVLTTLLVIKMAVACYAMVGCWGKPWSSLFATNTPWEQGWMGPGFYLGVFAVHLHTLLTSGNNAGGGDKKKEDDGMKVD